MATDLNQIAMEKIMTFSDHQKKMLEYLRDTCGTTHVTMVIANTTTKVPISDLLSAPTTKVMILDDQIRSAATSMKYFCGEATHFVFGEWRAWRAACNLAGGRLDPADFKKKSCATSPSAPPSA